MKSPALALLALPLLAAGAAADPVIDRLEWDVSKSRGVVITVEVTLTTSGEATVNGTVGGKTVSIRKKLKAGHRTLRIPVEPKKLRLSRLTSGLHYDLDVAVRENGGTETTQEVTAHVPLPCVVLPGLAHEQAPGTFGGFAAALDLATGGRYTLLADRPSMVVHEYASLSASLATLGKGLDKKVKATLKGTPFAKVDLVGYSYGGVVARSYLSLAGGSRVRDCVFLGTPNEGTPIAYIGVGLLNNGQLATLLGANPELAAAVGGLVNDDTKQTLRNLFPTYSWITPDNFLTQAIVTAALGDPTTPLTSLNQKAPPAGVNFHAFYYSSTGAEIGTVDVVDVSALSSLSGSIDPSTIATGAGDGVVPVHSVTMNNFAAWNAVIVQHDLGVGTHVTMPADILGAIPGVAAVLTAE